MYRYPSPSYFESEEDYLAREDAWEDAMQEREDRLVEEDAERNNS